LMENGRSHQGNFHHALLGYFPALANVVSHFAGFAQANADPALLITHHHQGTEAETASAFDHFGGPIDKHHFLGKLIDGFAIGAEKFGAAFGGPAPPGTASKTTTAAASTLRTTAF